MPHPRNRSRAVVVVAVWRRFLPALASVALLVNTSACRRAVPVAPDDEALARARTQNAAATPQEVAAHFYPSQIDDYFPGMDAVVDRAKAPVSQLADVASAAAPAPAAPVAVAPAEDAQPAAAPTAAPAAAPTVWPEAKTPALSQNEVFGRNTWMIWSGGNERFWDWLASNGYGFVDLLKLVDSRTRATRFQNAGLINEPAMMESPTAGAESLGLWLDMPTDDKVRQWRERYIAEAFFNTHSADAYKSTGPMAQLTKEAYELHVPPPEIYGLSSGVVGLRLFPNPAFLESEPAQKAWDAKRYYADTGYYEDPKLIRPFRVGMSCAFCHASFHPLNPPQDVAEPHWENLSGNIGAQYLRIRAVFGNLLKPDSLVYHILDSQPPGTIDTSLIASDNVNNTNTMNSIFGLPQRVLRSFWMPREELSQASATEPSLWGNLKPTAAATPAEAPKPEGGSGSGYGPDQPWKMEDDQVSPVYKNLFESLGMGPELAASNGINRRVPRVLLDGADSVGAWIALARVYLNIGSYSERWVQLHNPLVGIVPQDPFTIADCRAHSAYWNATQARVGPMRDYFLAVTPPMPLLSLKDVQAGAAATSDAQNPQERALHVDTSKLKDGRRVFAHNCIVCHSSLQPETLFVEKDNAQSDEQIQGFVTARAGLMVGKNEAQAFAAKFQKLAQARHDHYASFASKGEFWDHNPGQWLENADYIAWAESVVEKEDFWRNNYLSTDYRIPISLVRTNSARAMATNGMSDHIWQDYTSESYRHLPSVGAIDFYNPYPWKNIGTDRPKILDAKFPYPFTDKGNGEQAYMPAHKAPPGVPEGGGGPGFYRVPTLLSIWSTAPLLHNNSLGNFNNDPSTQGRLLAFDDAIRKLLWPERRFLGTSYNDATPERLKADHGLIWRTPEATYLNLPAKFVPVALNRVPLYMSLSGAINQAFPWLNEPTWAWLPSAVLILLGLGALHFIHHRKPRLLLSAAFFGLAVLVGVLLYLQNGHLGDVRIGPVPKGTPVNLLANINPEAEPAKLVKTLKYVVAKLAETEKRHLSEEESQRVMREEVAPALMEISKCPDFVMDKGHYYEWFKKMTDADKEALIELLKTF